MSLRGIPPGQRPNLRRLFDGTRSLHSSNYCQRIGQLRQFRSQQGELVGGHTARQQVCRGGDCCSQFTWAHSGKHLPHDMRRGDISGMPELPIFLGAAPQCLPSFRKMPENVHSAFRGFEPINTKIQ